MKSTDLTKEYYNSISRGYRELYHQEQIEKINEVKDFFLNSGKILDLGSGDGVLNQFIDDSCELFSFDLSQELLDLNSNKESHKECGSCEDLVYEENYFDAVYSFSMLQDVESIDNCLNEIKRVLVDHGLLVISFVRWGSRVDLMKEKIVNLSSEILFEKELEKDYIYVIRI